MISSVSSSSAVAQYAQAQQAAKPPAKPQAKQTATQQPDTVKLSKQAQAAADVDHDGDSR